MNTGKWHIVFALLLICIGMSTTQALAQVDSTNNNFTLLDPINQLVGGTNDVHFTWDGTLKTSVAASGQVSNATISSTCPFFGLTWNAHDVAIYGPGTYTIYAGCPAGSPGCGAGTPITFTVGLGEMGAHILFDWSVARDIDMAIVLTPNAIFTPSPMWTMACGSNSPSMAWDWMSKDFDGNGVNGAPMVDGPFVGFNANFNLMGGVPPICQGVVCTDNNACTTDSCDPATGNCVFTPINCNDNNACTSDTCNPATGCVHTPIVVCNDNNACTTDMCDPATGYCVFTPINCNDNDPCTDDSCDSVTGQCVHIPNNTCAGALSNFTMLDPVNQLVGGTNDVHFTWDGTLKTSVAASGQVSNATLSSTCPFFGLTWNAHDVAIYGPGTYTVYTGCPTGSPGCGTGVPITFTVGAGELGAHILFNWGATTNIDVVNVLTPNAVFAPSPMWTGACGSNPASTVWDWMSKDWDGDGINGAPMVDGPFVGFNANFNVMGGVPIICEGVVCNDNNACTADSCDPLTRNCVFTPISCDDSNACTADSCDPVIGCAHTPIVFCNDNNACTTDTCEGATGNCVFTPISCDDNNACTYDSCYPATGCVHAPINVNDNDPCTIDTCNPATGAVFIPKNCDDNNPCTTDTCDRATGNCVHTPTSTACIGTTNNNFTMIDAIGNTFGGTNDVHFTWDGTLKTSVAASGQVSNATLSSTCPFFGLTWNAHDVAIYGPGTYTVYTGCPTGSPGCGTGVPITFTVGAGELGAHILFNWGATTNIDVVNVLTPNAVFAPSPMWTGACGSNPASTVWDWMSKDWDGDGINGAPMVDGPFVGFNVNFNLMGAVADLCANVACPAVMVCNSPLVCDPATGQCVPQNPSCDDGNACTNDSCDLSTGQCVHTPINCNDNNACTNDYCYPATGCVHYAVNVNDNDACTIDSCNPLTGAVFTPRVCNDNNACTVDSCDRATGCVFTPVACNDNNACTADSCDPATGCVYMPVVCDDNNLCTNDSCDPATGCVFAPKCPACATCDPAVGICGTCCPAGSVKTVTIRGGGQNPRTVDLQIQTAFTVTNDGCIADFTASSITCTPGTIMSVNFKAGTGPHPSSATWNGVPIPMDTLFTIECPAATGEVGKLLLDNKDSGGKDADRITVSVQ